MNSHKDQIILKFNTMGLNINKDPLGILHLRATTVKLETIIQPKDHKEELRHLYQEVLENID